MIDIAAWNDRLAVVREECELKMRILEPGYRVRTLVEAGGALFDPLLGYVDDDGSVVLSDIGGQSQPGWNPDQGHGAIWRMDADGCLSPIVPPGTTAGMIQVLRRAPASFGHWTGHTFHTGQSRPGRSGALAQHLIYKLAPGADRTEPFSEIPPAGTIGGGTPGAAVIGGFGRDGTAHEGMFLSAAMMNCTVYATRPDGVTTPLFTLDETTVPRPLMPYKLFYAGPTWGEHAGELLIAALPGSSFERSAPRGNVLEFYVVDGDRVRPDPIGTGDLGLALAEVAPAGFGRLAGSTFSFELGSINLMHVSKPPPGPLPYDGRMLSTAADGSTTVFADRLQGGFNTMLFGADRLYVACLRRSYSTGEYHLPDGSISVIEPIAPE